MSRFTAVVVAGLTVCLGLVPLTPAQAAASPTAVTIPGGPASAMDSTPVTIDADLWLPDVTPAPAIVLAHGFGGSKASVAEDASYFTDRGFVVLAYSARGFGQSTGRISMNAPAFEVADAQAVIDYLGTVKQVKQEATNDPIVGVAGGSYGGALALMVAGYDARVDAIAADITWNDLQRSLFAQSANAPQPGVYKQLWTASFFSAGLTNPDGQVTTCGRFSEAWCAAYTSAATTGTVTRDGAALMRASSPASITNRITVPTLLGGGQADSLFPLAEVNANAEQISAANPDVPVKVVWHAAGHDGGVNETERLRALTGDWMSAHLAGGPAVSNDFEVSLVEGSALSDRDSGTVEVLKAPDYPGLFGQTTQDIALLGPPQQVLAPAGGLPAAISTLPGLGGLSALAGGLNLRTANQTATFVSEPLEGGVRVIGSSRIQLAVASTVPMRDATLFASLRIVGPNGRQSLPAGLVAPIRLANVGIQPISIDVDLPAIVSDVAPGDRLAVVITTTDQAYRPGDGPAVMTIALEQPSVAVPLVDVTGTSTSISAWAWPLVAALVVLLVLLLLRVLRPRRDREEHREALTQTPVKVEGLVKQFKHGVRAVDGIDFEVRPGVVLGLLGPNGAGKTTTMRMVMGLIAPSDGGAYVFGDRVHPGSPVLSRIGSFIEGPGFLPHLTGRRNLDMYWRASGRSGQDPHLDEVLEIAGLGSAVDRKVRTYSQGMRQRLGIAQAMLGLPDLLLLDEPTNGLDPPQIREMRKVVQEYAKAGRTVVISSHLLAEVEQTCTDVIVMHRGRVIASGSVADLLAGRSGQRLEDVFMEMVGQGHEVSSS